MSNLGFGMWYEGGNPSCYAAPKKSYSLEEFDSECEVEADGYYDLSETREGFARWYPNAPEGIDTEGGCYSFCKEGKGAFPVWIKDVKVSE